jgi:hypothetical protein
MLIIYICNKLKRDIPDIVEKDEVENNNKNLKGAEQR